MNDKTFLAFGDELVKIAFYKKLVKGFTNAMKEGWHGTPAQRAAGEGQTWFGKGRQLSSKNSGPIARRVEEATSLGGLTKALPVGNKSFMALGTALAAREAMQPNDPLGQDRSRAERVTGLAGETAGGLAGAAMGMRLMPKSNFIAPLMGGLLGSKYTKKVVTSPFVALRNHQQQQMPQQQEQMMPGPGVVQ